MLSVDRFNGLMKYMLHVNVVLLIYIRDTFMDALKVTYNSIQEALLAAVLLVAPPKLNAMLTVTQFYFFVFSRLKNFSCHPTVHYRPLAGSPTMARIRSQWARPLKVERCVLSVI